MDTSSGKHIIDFSADWCGPCKRIAPLFNELKKENSDIYFHKVDVDQEEEIARKYKVESLPTFIGIVNGKEVERFEGANNDRLRKMVERLNKM